MKYRWVYSFIGPDDKNEKIQEEISGMERVNADKARNPWVDRGGLTHAPGGSMRVVRT